jgi:hypothetical protein
MGLQLVKEPEQVPSANEVKKVAVRAAKALKIMSLCSLADRRARKHKVCDRGRGALPQS